MKITNTLLSLFLFLAFYAGSNAQTQGPLNGAVFANDATIGTIVWSNPSSATLSDNSYAKASGVDSANFSNYLKASGFGFTIPLSKKIDGIEVSVESKLGISMLGTDASTASIVLLKGGNIQGQDKNDLGNAWSTTEIIRVYGGAADTWGSTWTPADINDPNFGVAVATGGTNGNGGTTLIDWIGIKVFYSDTTPTSYNNLEQVSLNSLYPNPAGEKINLQLTAASSDNYTVSVLNTLGEIVSTEKYALTTGSNLLHFDLAGYPSGFYILRLEDACHRRAYRNFVVN